MLERARLARFFTFPAPVRVLVLLAPAGYGKSVAVRSFLGVAPWVHYRVGREQTTFARFVRGFAEAVAAVAPGAQAAFPRAWERALQSGASEAVLARWLCEHLQGADVDIVIDDLHEAGSDPRIAAFLEEFVQVRTDRRLAITARAPGQLPIPLWMATGIMDRPIDEAELRFTPDEAFALANGGDGPGERHAPAEDGGGCPVAVAYAIGAAGALHPGGERRAVLPSFAFVADQIFAGRSPRERQFLLSASLLPALNVELLEACGWTDWAGLCAAMAADAAFMWEAPPHSAPRFHDRFADYLAAQILHEEPALRVALARRAVTVLQDAGHHAEGLQVAVRQGLVTEIDSLLDTHGFAILESGRVDEISEALNALDERGIAAGSVGMAIRGYLDANFGRFDTSEAWFSLSLDRTNNPRSRVAIALYYARSLMHQFRDDAFLVLEPYADSTTLPHDVLIDVRSSLGQAYVIADRIDEARMRVAQALAMVGSACSDALRARVFGRAAYVANETGDAATAREYAVRAGPIAVAEGLYDVATSVYTILYTIAYDIDDDPAACFEHLDRVRHYGMKSGTTRLDLYALVAMYELYCEAGDRQALAQLDSAISALDVKYATGALTESFLPARARQAGWGGNFSYGQTVLTPTADRQETPFLRALRWSEVALYAAAAGEPDAANAALESARTCLEQGGQRTTAPAFATLNGALTLYVLNDIERARAWLQRVDSANMPQGRRVRAFHNAIAALLDHAGDPDDASRLPSAIDGLHAASFGGIALLIESLPMTGVERIDSARVPTIGAHLAGQRLDGLYLEVIASSEYVSSVAEQRLFDWLRTAWSCDVDSRSLRPALLRWTPPSSAPASARGRALSAKMRAFAKAGSGAPAIVSAFDRTDDIDARIDLLFSELKVAAPLMAEHSQAVSAWCTRIARRLGLAEDEITYITRCGLLHDIGKVKTPAEILEAPRRLEPHEWTIMRDHAAEGGRMAGAIPSLLPYIPVIRGHHERLDGKGYPDGLRTTAIPLAARVVTVADCFNAMIGRRPYRLPLLPTAALDELDGNRHTQFDPEVVDAMVQIVMGLTPTAATTISS